ncbi:uncharacterized protein METZ01_LOCUS171140, partial [marine metagenome]
MVTKDDLKLGVLLRSSTIVDINTLL